ncbi:hypothetical protein JOE66_002787 [Subtercola frigoramans]|uniref:Uncharacterized protein n=1 Tax=Subtercola frigoramans TaxID=120298 RepID=A0ABS2L7S4_9MICO|nr:hypothetical protein [Subtercola frigoramans]
MDFIPGTISEALAELLVVGGIPCILLFAPTSGQSIVAACQGAERAEQHSGGTD